MRLSLLSVTSHLAALSRLYTLADTVKFIYPTRTAATATAQACPPPRKLMSQSDWDYKYPQEKM